MGTGVGYMMASAAFRLLHPPMVVGSMGMLWGYLKSVIGHKPRYGDREFRRFLRAYQWSSMLHGKRAATAALNTRGAIIWKPGANLELKIR
jgi:hypothetical protein